MSAADANEPQEFIVQCTGDLTGKSWYGKFWAKPILSHRDRLLRGRLRGQYVGDHPEQATVEEATLASVLSDLQVRITKSPEWWAGCGFGENLQDVNVMREIYNKAIEIETKYMAVLNEKSKAAETPLQAKAEAMDAPEKG